MTDSSDLLFSIDDELEATSDVEEGVRAYGLDLSFNWATLKFRMAGGSPRIITGQETVVESAVKALLTPRYEFAIYTDDYGSELTSLLGLDHALARALIPQMVKEAILEDGRVESVEVTVDRSDGANVFVSLRLRDFTGAFVRVPVLTVPLGQ